jgi:hypothetical protein
MWFFLFMFVALAYLKLLELLYLWYLFVNGNIFCQACCIIYSTELLVHLFRCELYFMSCMLCTFCCEGGVQNLISQFYLFINDCTLLWNVGRMLNCAIEQLMN